MEERREEELATASNYASLLRVGTLSTLIVTRTRYGSLVVALFSIHHVSFGSSRTIMNSWTSDALATSQNAPDPQIAVMNEASVSLYVSVMHLSPKTASDPPKRWRRPHSQ